MQWMQCPLEGKRGRLLTAYAFGAVCINSKSWSLHHWYPVSIFCFAGSPAHDMELDVNWKRWQCTDTEWHTDIIRSEVEGTESHRCAKRNLHVTWCNFAIAITCTKHFFWLRFLGSLGVQTAGSLPILIGCPVLSTSRSFESFTQILFSDCIILWFVVLCVQCLWWLARQWRIHHWQACWFSAALYAEASATGWRPPMSQPLRCPMTFEVLEWLFCEHLCLANIKLAGSLIPLIWQGYYLLSLDIMGRRLTLPLKNKTQTLLMCLGLFCSLVEPQNWSIGESLGQSIANRVKNLWL